MPLHPTVLSGAMHEKYSSLSLDVIIDLRLRCTLFISLTVSTPDVKALKLGLVGRT